MRTGEYTFTRLETTRGEEADKCTVSRSVSRFSAGFVYSFNRPTRINPARIRDLIYFIIVLMFSLDLHPARESDCSKRLFFGGSINKRTRFPGGIKKKEGESGKTDEVGIQRCTVCSLAFNFSTRQ